MKQVRDKEVPATTYIVAICGIAVFTAFLGALYFGKNTIETIERVSKKQWRLTEDHHDH